MVYKLVSTIVFNLTTGNTNHTENRGDLWFNFDMCDIAEIFSLEASER